VANCRADFQWKLAHELCRQNAYIAVEDLSIREMEEQWKKKAQEDTPEGRKAKRNRKQWDRKVNDLGWAEFLGRLVCVAEKYGTEIVKIGKYEPSSQLCSCCGYKNEKVKNLDVRKWTCPNCGERHDRDVNAAINILRIAKEGKGVSLGKSPTKSTLADASVAGTATA